MRDRHFPTTRTKSYDEDDLVVCVLRGGFSRVERCHLARDVIRIGPRRHAAKPGPTVAG